MNTKRAWILWLLAGMLAIQAPAAERPNIVVMMADDLGFSDIGCYGGEIPTPNLDRLAANGVRLTGFYNTSRCCPSRASLLTGLYSHQVGIGEMNHPGKPPAYAGQLAAHIPTIAEIFKANGYNTAMVGKWHVTMSKTIDDGPNGSWPFQRGFDRYYGTMEGAKFYFNPKWLFENEKPITEFPKDYFYTNAISSRAADYIREQPEDKPLFLYVAFYAPHFPLQAPAEVTAKFRKQYLAGWDKLRQARHERQLSAGIVPNGTPLSERAEGVPAWETLSPERKDEMDLRMAIYAAQVHLLDQGVGRVVQALSESGKLDNTLLVFLSDNGGANTGGAFGAGPAELIGTPDTPLQSTYGEGWANLSNTPYRRFKANTHEGGVRAPFIIHWPERVQEKNTLRHTAAHIIDLLPTCLAAAGIPKDSGRDKKDVPPLRGQDILALTDNSPGRPLFFEHIKSRAMRYGKWKIVNYKKTDEWELYDLETDRTEENNLAASRPEKLRELSALWYEWAKRYHVQY